MLSRRILPVVQTLRTAMIADRVVLHHHHHMHCAVIPARAWHATEA